MSPRGAIQTPFLSLRNRKDWLLAAVHSGYLFSPQASSGVRCPGVRFSCISRGQIPYVYADTDLYVLCSHAS